MLTGVAEHFGGQRGGTIRDLFGDEDVEAPEARVAFLDRTDLGKGGIFYLLEVGSNTGGTGIFSSHWVLKQISERPLFWPWLNVPGGDRCNDGQLRGLELSAAKLVYTHAATPFRLLNSTDQTDWRWKALRALGSPDDVSSSTFLNWRPYDDVANCAICCAGEVVKGVTGQCLPDLFAAEVFAPLGLRATFIYSDPADERPVWFYAGSRRLHLPRYLASVQAEGGMVTTASELATIERAVMGTHQRPDLRALLFALVLPGAAVETNDAQASARPLSR